MRWDRPTLLSIMCCQQTPHDAHGGVEPCPCARCYRITGTRFNKSCSRGWRASSARWASATSCSSRFWNWCGFYLLPYFRGQVGRPEEDRAALARAFIAKAVFDIPTTRGLIERLEVDGRLCRLCGWSGAGRLPSEATFSRAFSEFAESRLANRLHETLIARTMDGHLVEHISRDATAIEAREKAAPKPKAAKPKRRKRGRPRKGEARAKEKPAGTATDDEPSADAGGPAEGLRCRQQAQRQGPYHLLDRVQAARR